MGLDVAIIGEALSSQVANPEAWAAENGSGFGSGYEPASSNTILGLRFRTDARSRRSRLVSDAREDLIEQFMDRLASKVRDFVPAPGANLLKGDQLCARLGISASTLMRYRKAGLPCVDLGRSYRYDLAAVLEWIKGRAA